MKPMKQLRVDFFDSTSSSEVWRAIDYKERWESDSENHVAYTNLFDAITHSLADLHPDLYGTGATQLAEAIREQI